METLYLLLKLNYDTRFESLWTSFVKLLIWKQTGFTLNLTQEKSTLKYFNVCTKLKYVTTRVFFWSSRISRRGGNIFNRNRMVWNYWMLPVFFFFTDVSINLLIWLVKKPTTLPRIVFCHFSGNLTNYFQISGFCFPLYHIHALKF